MGSSKAKEGKLMGDSGKYARYTPEQVEILERVYNDCPKPSSSRRQQLIRDCPMLTNICQKQLKVWFQNRRCREKQRKETGRLQNWNSKLNAMNQMLLEENERLQKQAAQLMLENQYLKKQLEVQHPLVDLNQQVVVPSTNDTSSESVVTSGQRHHSPQHASQDRSISQGRLSSVADRILAEFLAKATGGLVDGIPLPGMKPGPDSIGVVVLPSSGGHVVAQACGFVDLGIFKVADMVKNRQLWLPDCRKQDIKASFSVDHVGLIEIVHTQMYSPTTSIAAREFWTLRYTCVLENGNLVVCEGSIIASQGVHEISSLPGFVRAEMLPSGFLIRPCEQGGSMVMVVDDMNFMSSSLTEGIWPLYDTSAHLAWRVTRKVLSHLRGLPKEKGETGFVNGATPSLQGFSHRLIRGFNDAVNCFPDDGWVPLIDKGPSTVSVYINPSHKGIPPTNGGIVCAKASLLLHGVSPALLMAFIKEQWIAWVELDAETNSADWSSHQASHGNRPKRKFSSVRVSQPVSEDKEVLEVMQLQKSNLPKSEDGGPETDSYLLQLSSTKEDSSAKSAYDQLLFAPIDASMSDDGPLLPSGFRIVSLDTCSDKVTPSQHTLDLASSLEDHVASYRIQKQRALCGIGSSLIIVFQYMYEAEIGNVVALKAQQNVQALVDILHQAAASLGCHPSPPSISNSKFGMEAVVLVQQLADSYRVHIGQELLLGPGKSPEDMFKSFWNLPHAVVCCAWKPLPEFIFANHAALEMLECSLFGLREMSLERMFNDGCKKTDYSQPPPFLQKEGYAHLPAGVCLTSMGRPVSFERASGWEVVTGDPAVRVAAFMFINWSLMGLQSLPGRS